MNPIRSTLLRRRSLGALAALALLFTGVTLVYCDPAPFGQYPCDGRWMSASQVAAFRHISLETLAQIRAARGLTVPEVCTIPQDKLERAIFRAANPKPDHPGEAVALRNLQLQDENGFIPPDGFERASEHIEAMSAVPQPEGYAAGITSASWTWIGPGNIGGRVRSLVIHPLDPNIMWAGSVSGGIWKTADAGASWQILDDFMANMAVSTLAIDPTDPNILYAGTGEGFYNGDGLRGAGVFKTADGGMTWAQLASTASSSWYYVNRLAIQPSNPLVLLAATGSGIFKSTDGGASWSLREGSYRYYDINFSPDGARAIASAGYGVALYSGDAGDTWLPAPFVNLGTLDSTGRVEVAFAPSDASIVYASVNRNNGEVWKSTDYGQTYTLVNSGNFFLGSQGWYNNTLWVDPSNANRLMVGGIDLWRSVDGGASLTKVSQWQVAPDFSAHADQHIIVEHPSFDGALNKTLFFGNDGGVYRADDYSSVAVTSGWSELNNNLGITQFYGGAGSPLTGAIVGGTQDNGTLLYTPDNGAQGWTSEFGGDGGWSAIDPADPNYIFGEYVYGQVHRSADGGASAEYIWGIYVNGTDVVYKPAPYLLSEAKDKKGNFIAPLVLDPNDAGRLYVGLESLWRTNNAKAATTPSTGPAWYAVKAASAGNPISAIAVKKGNPDILWVGHNNGDVYRTSNGTSAAPAWIKMDDGATPLPNRYVTRISPHPSNPGVAYVTFGGFSSDNLWRTTDNGATWTDRTGSGLMGLPDVPLRSLALHPDYPSWIYAGSEVGVFASEDAGATWKLPHDGPTNTSVDELFWVNYTLVAATHGRGMYKIAVISPITIPVPEMNVKGNNRSIQDGDVTPSPDDHSDFGAVDVASPGLDRTFIIQNTGEDYLDLPGTPAVRISGTHAADFSVTVSPSTSIEPNSAADFTVHFAPQGLGLRTATISIDNNDPNEDPYNFNIQGTGSGCFPAASVKTNANSGAGSLRQALSDVCTGGTVTFQDDTTILLSSTLTINRNVTIDGAGHTVILDGQNLVRILFVEDIDWSPVTVTTRNLTFRNGRTNSHGAGILNLGNLVVENSTFIDNHALSNGGALFNNQGGMSVTNSTFSGNSASYGGGIFNNTNAHLTVANSTLSGNEASTSGGAVFNQGALDLSNAILANSVGSDCVNAGTIGTKTSNLIEGQACGLVNGENGNRVGVDPNLGALAGNGGLTQTMALLNGSPAFNAGDDATCAASPVNAVDQRGMARPQGAHCDIGAYEAEVITVTANPKAITYADPDPDFDFTLDPPGAGLSTQPVCSVSGAHSNAGSYPITCAGGAPSDARYLIEYVPGTLTVGKADPVVTLSVSNSPAIYTGTPQGAMVISAGTPGSISDIQYDGSSTMPVNAGAYAVTADFLPADTTNYKGLADLPAGDFVIEKAIPSLSVTNSAVTYNGLSQTASVSGSVPGAASNLQYNGSSTVPSGAGTYAVTADFMPGDAQNYHSLIGAPAGDFTITPATPVVTLRVTNAYVLYNGSPQSATVKVASASVPGVIDHVRYNGSTSLPVAAGVYAITADFIPADPDNYRTLSGVAAGNFVIRRERARNGGFNSYSGTSTVPLSWAKNYAFAGTDGKNTKVKKEGAASLKIAGNGKPKTLTQTLALSGKAGDRLDFSFWARGASIPTAGACQAQVLLYNGSILKQTRTVKCGNGTYISFQKKSLNFNASAAFTKVVIKITYSKANGTVWFDLVSLVK